MNVIELGEFFVDKEAKVTLITSVGKKYIIKEKEIFLLVCFI